MTNAHMGEYLLREQADPTDINMTLDCAFGDRMREQVGASEWEQRLDAAAYAAAAILNAPLLRSGKEEE